MTNTESTRMAGDGDSMEIELNEPVPEGYLGLMETPLEFSMKDDGSLYTLSSDDIRDAFDILLPPHREFSFKSLTAVLQQYPWWRVDSNGENECQPWNVLAGFILLHTRDMDDYPTTNPLNIPSQLIEIYIDPDISSDPLEMEAEIQADAQEQIETLQERFDTLYFTEMAVYEIRFALRKWLDRVYNHQDMIKRHHTPGKFSFSAAEMERFASSIRVLQHLMNRVSPVDQPENIEGLYGKDDFAPVCRSVFSIKDTPPLVPRSTYLPVESDIPSSDENE